MNILGIEMGCMSYDDMYILFDNWLRDKSTRSHAVAAINAYGCVCGVLDKHVRRAFNAADIVGIDSMPFVYWARRFYEPRTDRLYPPDMILHICSRAGARPCTFYLYGGYPGAAAKIEGFLKNRYQGVQVVGAHAPPFRELTEEEDAAICDEINRLQPDFVWVGLGSPRQDQWIQAHKEKIRGSIMVASGALFDFYSGRIRQAPRWIRCLGFEWLYRLFQDFPRLWKRYTVYNIIFVVLFVFQRLRMIRFSNADASEP